MKNKKALWTAVLILSLACFAVCAVLLCKMLFGGKSPSEYIDTDTDTQAVTTTTADNRPENPVDFKALQATNKDVYAWISVPGCEIEYPILQSFEENDDFYLHHNLEKQYEYAGCIYTEKHNKKDFTDPNTVIYGHNMLNGTMFSNLLKYKDPEFFNQNKYIYIYTPVSKLTYQIFSAYKYDDRHILNSFDFSYKEVFAQYIEDCKNPKSLTVNTNPEVEVTADDKIITLSTCMGQVDNYRYLVQGVLISNEYTK
ncbi:MAG: class B sortase [Oscillospiraceae bacterium]